MIVVPMQICGDYCRVDMLALIVGMSYLKHCKVGKAPIVVVMKAVLDALASECTCMGVALLVTVHRTRSLKVDTYSVYMCLVEAVALLP